MGNVMDILKEDVDRLFSYNTIQQVKILDRWLGVLNNVLTLIIMCYIVIYVFIYDKGYLEYEQAKGVLLTHVYGDAVAQGTQGDLRYFAGNEITYPGLENGNVMIATKVEIAKQKRGVCLDLDMPCASADDCSDGVGAECTEEGFCKEPAWCPDGDARPDTFKLDTADLQIWVKSGIQYLRLKPNKYFSVDFSKPISEGTLEDGRNTFTVRSLLDNCDPPVRFEEISELGAAVEVQFVWDCNVDRDKCTPHIQARRVDSLFDPENIGFKFTYPHYTGPDKRNKVTVQGVRLYLRALGTGMMVSPAAIILKVSTGLTLLGLAQIFTDLLMIKCFKGRSAIYFSRKFDITEDISDKFAEMEKKAQEGEAEPDFEADDEDADALESAWRRRMDEED
jgi:P2X purinoceptor 4